MPLRAPRGCTEPRCPSTAEPGTDRCASHPRPGRWATGAPGRVMPPDWAATRARIFQRDGHRCRQCGTGPAEVCDHIVRGLSEEDWNLQALCCPCSDAKTQREAAAARASAVYGPTP